MGNIQLIEVTPDNLDEYGMFCNKNPKSKGYIEKAKWYSQVYKQGVRMNIAINENGDRIGFIEYAPAEHAWRPIDAPGYMFIHCMYIYSTDDRKQGNGSQMVKKCEEDAKKLGLKGVAVMTSRGPWVATKKLFIKKSLAGGTSKGVGQIADDNIKYFVRILNPLKSICEIHLCPGVVKCALMPFGHFFLTEIHQFFVQVHHDSLFHSRISYNLPESRTLPSPDYQNFFSRR